MTAKTKKPNLQADAAYEHAQLVARDLLERVRELLDDLPAPGVDGHPVHWGHVGDVGRVNTLLLEAVAFLGRAGG